MDTMSVIVLVQMTFKGMETCFKHHQHCKFVLFHNYF